MFVKHAHVFNKQSQTHLQTCACLTDSHAVKLKRWKVAFLLSRHITLHERMNGWELQLWCAAGVCHPQGV